MRRGRRRGSGQGRRECRVVGGGASRLCRGPAGGRTLLEARPWPASAQALEAAPGGPSLSAGPTSSAEGFPSSSAGSQPPRTSGITAWTMRTCPSESRAPGGWRLLPGPPHLPVPRPPVGAPLGLRPLPLYVPPAVRRLTESPSPGAVGCTGDQVRVHTAPPSSAPPITRLLLSGPQKAKPAGHTGSAPSGAPARGT